MNPKVRDLSEFTVVGIAGDVLILDERTLVCHTLSSDLFEILKLCDGTRSRDRLALDVYGSESQVAVSRIDLALIQLADAGLLDWAHPSFIDILSRREVMKMAGAALLGAIGLPLMTSITLSDSAAAQTLTDPNPFPSTCGETGDGDVCEDSNACEHCCCCRMLASGYQFCAASGDLCGSYGWPCVYPM